MNLDGVVVRTPSDVVLTSMEHLPPEVRSALGSGFTGPRAFGLARRSGSAAAKVIDADIALLLYASRDAGPVPGCCRSALGHGLDRVLRELITDGLLEVWAEDAWLTGPAALADAWDEPERHHPLSRLSRDLIAEAARDVEGVQALSMRLYGAHRLPWTRRFAAEVAACGGMEAWLTASEVARSLPTWRSASAQDDDAWLQLTRADGGRDDASAPTFKLYVGCAPRALPRVYEAVARAIDPTAAFAFKVGRQVEHVLRPDKLVIYFRSRSDLSAGAERLCAAVEPFDVHPVPFTAPADATGAWSWGIDPPAEHGGTTLAGRDSWRLHLCTEIAIGIAAAQRDGLDPAGAARFAVRRLEDRGVDVMDWTPPSHLWNGAAG